MNINSDQYQTAYSIFNYNNINKSFAFVRVFNGITPIKYKVDATFIIPKNNLVFCCELDNDKEINPISTTKYILLEDFLIPKRFNERLKFLKNNSNRHRCYRDYGFLLEKYNDDWYVNLVVYYIKN